MISIGDFWSQKPVANVMQNIHHRHVDVQQFN